MGGKTQQSSSQVSIPPEVLARYNSVNAQAQNVAATPFQQYSSDPNAFVAPLTTAQQAGIQQTGQYANAAQPWLQQAGNMTMAGSGAATPGALGADQINQYMSPFTQNVTSQMGALMNQQAQTAQSGQMGNAIKSGAFGGDRAGVAAANLQGQNALAYGNAMAPVLQAGYNTALQTAGQQQQLDYASQQANLQRQMAGGQQMAGLGMNAQQAGLAGAQAMMGAGQMQQQTQQAGQSALYNQYQQQQSYPFQVMSFLANIAEGTGALSGQTTNTTQPAPFFSDRRLKENVKKIGTAKNGLPIHSFSYKDDPDKLTRLGFMADEVEKKHPEAVGLAGGYKTVDYKRAARSYGGGLVPIESSGGSVTDFDQGAAYDRGGYGDGGGPNIQDLLKQQSQSYAPITGGEERDVTAGLPGKAKKGLAAASQGQPRQPLKPAQAPGQQPSALSQVSQLGQQAKSLVDTGQKGWAGAQALNKNLSQDTAPQKDAPVTPAAPPSQDVPTAAPPAPIVNPDTPAPELDNARGGLIPRHGYATDGEVQPSGVPAMVQTSVPSNLLAETKEYQQGRDEAQQAQVRANNVQDQQRANLASAGISATPDMTPFGQMMAARGLQNSAKVYGAPGGYYDPTNGGSMFGSRGGLMGRSHFESGGDAPYEGDTGPGGLDIPVDQSWREDKKEEDAMAPKPPPSSGGSGASDALGAIKGIAGLATMFLGTGGLAGRRRREDGGELKSDLPGLPPDEGGPPDSVAAPAAPQNSGTPERSWWDNLWGGGDLKYIPPAEQHAPNDDLDPRGPGGAWAPYGAKETPAPLPPPRPAGLVAAQPHERAVATDMPERPHKATGVAPREVQARAEQPRGRQPIMMMAAPEGGEKLQPGYHGDFFENWGRADGGRIYRDDGGALQSDLPGLPEDEGGPPAPKDLVSEPERPNLRDAPLPPVKPAGLVHTGMGNGPFQDVDSEGNVIDNKNLPESPRAPPVRPKTLAQAASAHPNPREFTAETSSAGEGEPIALESFSGIENQPRLKPADIPAKVPEATGVVPPAKVEPVEPVKVEPVKTAPVAPTGVVAPVKAAAPVEPVKTAPVAPTGVVAPVAKTPLDVSVPLGAGVLPPGLHKDASGHFVNDAGGVYDENYYKDGVQYTNKNGVWTRGPEARKEEGKSAQEYADESAAKAQKPEVAAPVAPAGGVVPPESKPVAPEAKTAPAVAPQSAAPASDEAESWRRGIKHVESNGGNYTILGPVITKGMYRGDRAYGAYQMMGRNIPSWSKEALGYSLTPQQLLARPDLQDKIFDFRFARDVKKYGSPQDAASVWFTGHPLSTAGNRSDQLGTTARGYAAKFTQGMNGSFVDQAGRVVRRAGRDLATSAENVGSTVKSGAESLGSAVRGGFDAVGNILGGGGGGGKGQRNFQANAADQGQGGKGGDQNWGQQAGNWFGQNQNWMIPLLTGLGTMASSNSRYLGSAVLQGLGGGAQAYGKQQADQANIQNVAAHTAYTNAQQGNLDQDTANRMIDNQRKAMTSTFGTMGQVYWTRDEKTGAMQPIPVGQYEEMQRKGTAPQFVSPPQVGTANTGASPGVPAVNPPVMGPNGQQVFSGHPVAPGAVAPGGAGAPAPVPAVAGAGTPAPAPAAGAEEKPVGAGAQIETAREARETGAGGAGGAGVGAAAITGRTSGVEAPPPPPAVEIDRQGVNYSGDTSTASHRYNRFDPTQKVYTDQGDADFKKVDQAANDAQTRAGLQQKMMKVSSDVLQNRGWMRTGLGESTRRDIFELINSAPTLWGGGISEKAQKTISDHQLMEKLSTIQAQQQTAGHPTNDMFNAMRQVANPNPSQQGKTVADLVASSIVEDTKNRDKKAFYTKYGSENRGSFYGASDRFAKDNPEGNYSLMKEHLSKLLEKHPEKVAEYILHAPKTPKESKAWSDSVFGNHEGRKTKYVPGFGRVFTGE